MEDNKFITTLSKIIETAKTELYEGNDEDVRTLSITYKSILNLLIESNTDEIKDYKKELESHIIDLKLFEDTLLSVIQNLINKSKYDTSDVITDVLVVVNNSKKEISYLVKHIEFVEENTK